MGILIKLFSINNLRYILDYITSWVMQLLSCDYVGGGLYKFLELAEGGSRFAGFSG